MSLNRWIEYYLNSEMIFSVALGNNLFKNISNQLLFFRKRALLKFDLLDEVWLL